MEFPLYDLLLERYLQAGEIDVARVAASVADIKCNCGAAASLAHYEQITALALHHWTRANPDKGAPASFPYPHKAVHQGRGLIVELRNLPPELQGIISMYVEHYGS